mmetsp:Transcript_13863/g.41872  ORF Transcript_13863/g.41872 Transcript_13863/m.41872 type:complete len:293 (+) Transcript_13863:87-965(+)
MSSAAGEGASVDGTQDAKATPVFGSASTFGGGFGGFAGVNAGTSPGFGGNGAEVAARDGEEGAGGAEEGAGEEDCSAEFKPVVQLEEVEVQTGEEGEEVLFDYKCKLYRYDGESDQWKERGVGQMKLLRHEENDLVRVLMRQDKTLKIRANHIVMPKTNMQEHSGNEKSAVWSAVDFDGEKQTPEMFCARFASQERAQQFISEHGKAMDHNEKVLAASQPAGGAEGGEEGGDAASTPAAEDAAAGEGAGAEADTASPEPTAQSDADQLAKELGTVRVEDDGAPAESKPADSS